MEGRHEHQARQLQEQISRLKDEVAEIGFERTPRLRDRNTFFNSLLHGEAAVCDEIRPRWQKFRERSREIKRLEKKLDRVARRGAKDTPGYRALSAKVDREKEAMRACERMIELIRLAQGQIALVSQQDPQDEASSAWVDQCTTEATKLLHAVRTHALVVDQKISPHRSLNANDVEKLDIEIPGSDVRHHVRQRKCEATNALLDLLERNARVLLRESAERERVAKDQRLQYLEKERARFDGPATPPS